MEVGRDDRAVGSLCFGQGFASYLAGHTAGRAELQHGRIYNASRSPEQPDRLGQRSGYH